MTEILTRREAILFAASAATQAAIAQSASAGLSVTNSQGVRIVPYGPYGNQSIPALSVLLPSRGNEVAAVVEMPEHAWRKRTKADEPEWFYRMYTNDTRLKGTLNWTRDKNTLNYRMSLPSGVGLNAKATLDADGLGIEYQIVNPDNVAFAEAQAPTCIKLYHPFTDVF